MARILLKQLSHAISIGHAWVGEIMTQIDHDGTKNFGNLTLGLSQREGLSASLYEDAGVVDSNIIFGIEAATSFNHSFDYDTDNFFLLPIDGYLDIAFSGDSRSAYNNRNGLRFSGGALDTVSSYGDLFPVLGGGAELYFKSEQTTDDPTVFGRFIGRYGRLGVLNFSSGDIDYYKITYDGVNLLFGSARLGLDFNDCEGICELSAEGVFGHISKDGGYYGVPESSEGPDLYDKIYGASFQLRLDNERFRLGLAYYFLSRSGGDHLGYLGEYGIDIDDDMERVSHRLAGNLALTVAQGTEAKVDLGIRANLYKSERESKFYTTAVLWEPVNETDVTYEHSNGTYINGYMAVRAGSVSFEIGGGYAEGYGGYELSCAPLCSIPETASYDSDNWNLYAATSLEWGGSKQQ